MADTTFIDYTQPAVNAAWLNDVNDNIYDTSTPPAGTFRASLADNTSATKGSGMVPFDASLAYATNTIGGKARQVKTFKDFGAVGDGVTDDTAAIALALASNADVMDDMGGCTYRITSQIAIPNSCFTRFIGVGNVPVPKSKFFVDFNGVAFKGAVGTTSFPCFENFYCYSLSGYANAQFLDHDGDCVHAEFLRLVLYNFKKIPLDLNTAFRCKIDILGQYCWDYILKIGGGSASYIKYTFDHSYGGGADINGGGHVIEPYTEEICTDNNPAGANASWRELILRGAQHTITGGVMAVAAVNNKYPIELAAARAVTFIGVRGFSLGAAPHWVNVNATDSSLTAVDCPDFTYGGTTTNVMILDGGYTTTKPDITISGQSVRNTTARVWTCFNGTTGVNNQASGLSSVTRTGVGTYRLTFPAFANVNYVVQISAQAGVVTAYRYANKTTTQIDIQVNNSASTAAVDADEVSVVLTGV